MSKLPIKRTYPSSWAKSSQSFFKFFAVPLGIFLCECLLWTRRLLWIILSGGEVSSISLSTSPFLISKHIQYNMVHIIWTNIGKFEIRPTALESFLISSFLNSSFELVLYGSISIGSLLIGFALTFGFRDRDVLDFRSRFLEPEFLLASEDRLGLFRNDFLSCSYENLLQINSISW